MGMIIIGGGISGLAAAYYARKSAPELPIMLLEAAERWGGKITTNRIPFAGGQFIIEGGPDTFLASKPWGVDLCRELGLETRLHGTNPLQKNTYVYRKGALLPLPEGLALMVPTDIPSVLRSRLVSWPGKLRMGLDFILPASKNGTDESLGSFITRRLGREAYEGLIEPLMSGIYAGDGDQLSLASTFPYLKDLEAKYGSLARGASAMRKAMTSRGAQTPGSRSAFLTPTSGLAELVEALVFRLNAGGVKLRLNSPVMKLQRHDPTGKWQIDLQNGERLNGDLVVLAVPAFEAARLLEGQSASLAASLKEIPYVASATVSLAYQEKDLPRPLDGYGYVIPRREKRQVLACTWTSTKFPHRAPAGACLIRVFFGRAGQHLGGTWDEHNLLNMARQEVKETLGITNEPLLSRTFIFEAAMPQYNLGHSGRMAAITSTMDGLPGLALAGNGYSGIGIPDCIHSGQLAVEKLLNPILENKGK